MVEVKRAWLTTAEVVNDAQMRELSTSQVANSLMLTGQTGWSSDCR